jgi:EAL domain-containing protein (putative c-di-GMP-specific phosphodiesterase class I)
MEPMTEWVLQEAAFQCRQWRAEDLCMGRISVNLDVGFYQPQALEAMLLQTVRDAGIEPTDLEFEILETAMRDEPKIAELWRRLVAAGFEIAIDDFGTGESSLSRIKQLPCSTLKIDRGFVRELSYDESDRTMTRTIIAMAKSLGKTALAEGVETEEQLRYLMRCGCDAVQGYLLCRPCPADATRAFVQAATSVELVRRLRDEIAQSDGAAECPPVHPCGDR